MNKKSTDKKYTKEKFNLKNRKIPILSKLKNNWLRLKKNNVHKSFPFIISCVVFGLVALKTIQFFLFARAFMIPIPREEFQNNYLISDRKLKHDVDVQALQEYLDKLEQMKLEREKELNEKRKKTTENYSENFKL